MCCAKGNISTKGWEAFGEALREANVPQDLIGHEDRWK
jgi:hypothetical protein